MARFSGKKTEFIAIVFDSRDEITDIRRAECDPARYSGRGVVFAAGTAPPSGDSTCRLVVRDMETGMSAVASTKGPVAAESASGLAMATPLLVCRVTGSALLDAGSEKKGDAWSWTEAYPLDFENQSPAIEPVPKSSGHVLVFVPCSVPEGFEPDLALSASVLRQETGENVPATFALVGRARKGPLEIVTLDLPVESLTAGTYHLFVYAQDQSTKTKAYARTSFTVVDR
jgi:hypothetical protein